MSAGREPERTCVGCRETAAKHDLIRLVRAPEGVVLVGPSSSVAGRGAYVHPAASCVDRALRRGVLARAFRLDVGPEELGRLRNILEGHVERA